MAGAGGMKTEGAGGAKGAGGANVRSTAGTALTGAGLGLRRELLPELRAGVPDAIRFFEIAPENWMEMGGAPAATLRELTRIRPLVCHGLSLSLGGPHPLDEAFLVRLKRFLDRYRVSLYTEHLSFCSDDGHLYDLLPIPFTADAVHHVAGRIRRAQDILQRRIAIENASFYLTSPIDEMDEPAFIRAVLDEADCDLHLDVNNVFVNSVNHGYDPYAFIDALPGERIVYLHVAGHERHPHTLLDTHGAAVDEAVWDLLRHVYRRIGDRPTLLERDFNIPPLAELLHEIRRIDALRQGAGDAA